MDENTTEGTVETVEAEGVDTTVETVDAPTEAPDETVEEAPAA